MKTASGHQTTSLLKPAEYFDSANIAESYAGIVLPLTCSFAERVYRQVYFDFLRMSGVPRRQLRQHASVFNNLLGFFYGRMYYNMNNWYRLAQFVPGYRRNKANFEAMITSRLQQEIPCDITPRPLLKLFYPLILLTKYLVFDLTSWRFKRHVQTVIQRLRQIDIEHSSFEECKKLFAFLEADLLHRWYVTLENDFFVMTYLGLIRQFTGDNSLQNVIAFKSKATEQVMALTELSQAIQKKAVLWRAVRDNQAKLFNRVLADYPALQNQLNQYLNSFGGRFANELKLETVDLDQDIAKLFRVLEAYAAYRSTPAKSLSPPETAFPLPKRLLFLFIRRKFIKYSARREEFRLLRSNMFSINRRLFNRLGHILANQRQLKQPADIFYLTVDEILTVNGHPGQTQPNLLALVAQRKKAYQTYPAKNPPAHFITRHGSIPRKASQNPSTPPLVRGGNIVNPPDKGDDRGFHRQWNSSENSFRTLSRHNNQAGPAGTVKAQGVSPGIVRGKVKVMKTFTMPRKVDFDILVTKHTDPGWTSLIALCRGLIIEHGGILSHASIIARELGIPAIIGVPNATDLFANGQIITLNGSDGTIKQN